MQPISIISMAISAGIVGYVSFGAVAATIKTLEAKREKKSDMRLPFFACLALTRVLAPQLNTYVEPLLVGGEHLAASPFESPYERNEERFQEFRQKNPQVLRAFNQAGPNAIHRGFEALGDTELDKRSYLFNKMLVNGSDKFASDFYKHRTTGDEIDAEVRKLDAEDVTAWFDLVIKAIQAVADKRVPVRINQQDKAAAWEHLLSHAPYEDSARLRYVLNNPDPADADAAWAARLLYQDLTTMNMPARAILNRMFIEI